MILFEIMIKLPILSYQYLIQGYIMTISNEVLALISQVAQKQVSANEELLSTGLIDSVSAMDLVMAIKQKFDVDLPFEQLVDILANSANIIQYVENNYKG